MYFFGQTKTPVDSNLPTFHLLLNKVSSAEAVSKNRTNEIEEHFIKIENFVAMTTEIIMLDESNCVPPTYDTQGWQVCKY